MVKAVLFDMDGILFDSEAYYMAGSIEVLRHLGYTDSEDKVYSVIGTTMEKTYDIYQELLRYQVSRKDIIMAVERYFTEHPINHRKYMFPDIPNALQTLKNRNKLLACCSSSSPDVIGQSLKGMGIDSYFDYVISSEEVKHAKPAPDVYLSAAAYLQCQPSECVVYEDSSAGVSAGKRAGMFVIGRKDDRFRQDLSQADLIVDHAEDMVNAVARRDILCQK